MGSEEQIVENKEGNDALEFRRRSEICGEPGAEDFRRLG